MWPNTCHCWPLKLLVINRKTCRSWFRVPIKSTMFFYTDTNPLLTIKFSLNGVFIEQFNTESLLSSIFIVLSVPQKCDEFCWSYFCVVIDVFLTFILAFAILFFSCTGKPSLKIRMKYLQLSKHMNHWILHVNDLYGLTSGTLMIRAFSSYFSTQTRNNS